MSVKQHFEYRPSWDLNASHIGISKWNWQSISKEDETEARSVMANKRFDVLPLINPNDSITRYYSTRIWNNYENLNLNTIGELDKVYYRLSFSDLIKKFHNEKKHYYFLTDYDSVVGLVSFVNLNRQEVYNHLYHVISDIERSVADFLKSHISSEDIISNFESSDDNHIKEVLRSYKNGIEQGSDNSIFENMYLQTIGITLNKLGDKIPNNKKKLISYSKKFDPKGTYGILRNKIMHPVRPILSDSLTISKINELLTDYEVLKELLN